jgi:hypothetical protein
LSGRGRKSYKAEDSGLLRSCKIDAIDRLTADEGGSAASMGHGTAENRSYPYQISAFITAAIIGEAGPAQSRMQSTGFAGASFRSRP